MTIRKNYKSVVFIYFVSCCCISNTIYSQAVASNGSIPTASHPREKFLMPPFENKVFIEEQGQFKKNLDEKKINFPGTILFAVNNPEFNT